MKIKNVRIIELYKLEIMFNNGEKSILDFEKEYINDRPDHKLIKELKNEKKFREIYFTEVSIGWKNDFEIHLDSILNLV